MIQQRKVATRSSDVLQKLTKILKYMREHPEGVTPKMIALNTTINVNTIKTLLPKIDGINKIMRGVYKVVNWGDGTETQPLDELRSWNFHNCILSLPFRVDSREIDLKIMKIIITNKTARISTDYPLNVTSLALVEDYVKCICGININEDILISSIEFNKDYANLRLDGVNCITVDNLITQFKAYQKKRGLRIEHKTKVPMNVENVVDMLTCNPNTLELTTKLNEQDKKINKLMAASCKNTAILCKLLEKQENESERIYKTKD